MRNLQQFSIHSAKFLKGNLHVYIKNMGAIRKYFPKQQHTIYIGCLLTFQTSDVRLTSYKHTVIACVPRVDRNETVIALSESFFNRRTSTS